MDDTESSTIVTPSRLKFFTIATLIATICLIIVIIVFLLMSLQSPYSSIEYPVAQSLKAVSTQSNISTTTVSTTTLSPEELQRLSLYKEFLNLSSNRPEPNRSRSSIPMNRFMRSVYQQIYDETGVRRKKRQANRHSNLYLTDEFDAIVSLPNQYEHSSDDINYTFDYDSSLDSLTYAELILPFHHESIIDVYFPKLNISIKQPITIDKHWLKIDLTQYVKSFPLEFHLRVNRTKSKISLLSSGFLTLYFRRSTHPIFRRDLSSFYDRQLITYPDDPSYCQVRPLRTSFSELDWSSWIVEPSSYEMNVCSGTCHTESNMSTYFIIQNLLNQKYPKQVPAPCCRPKRFSPTILLYYDGPNLVLKRHENMRVVECGCAV